MYIVPRKLADIIIGLTQCVKSANLLSGSNIQSHKIIIITNEDVIYYNIKQSICERARIQESL